MRRTADSRPVAVIDLGSNSVRLVIYDQLSRAPVSRLNERRLCGLGREVSRTGRLGEAGKTCAADALTRFVAIARAMGCQLIDVVATAAMRQASDGEAFIKKNSARLEVPIHLLSGLDEARFGAYGVHCGFGAVEGVMGDLGGGSVEFAGLPPDRTGWRPCSLPVGTLVLADALQGNLDSAQRLVDERFHAHPELEGAAEGKAFYVVGGSWRALARARMAMMDHPLRILHGYEIAPGEAETLGRTMTTATVEALSGMPGLPRRRLETVPAAGLLLATAVRRLRPARVVFSATGLREGRLFASLSAKRRLEDPLIAGTRDLGRLANRIPQIGDAMARWLEPLSSVMGSYRPRLVSAICHVSDSAWREHPETRAREAFMRLVQYPLLGIGHRERVTLAYAIFRRYEGRPGDPAIRRAVELLTPDDLGFAESLGQALDLGYRVSGGVPEIVDRCRLVLDRNQLKLEANHDAVLRSDESIRARLRGLASVLNVPRHAIVTSPA
jgi:exopolyphosphatase / guanosine-5'-triphosphate,3'-diphosphate pyrophosphatase